MNDRATSTSPSWLLLGVASLLIGPTLIVAANFAVHVVQSESWKSIPSLPAVTDDPPIKPRGVIAYVERPVDAPAEPGPGCIFVVAASGEQQPRKLGCSGDGTIPDSIASISWTRGGDLAVRSDPPLPTPPVVPVGAGRALPGSIPELKRTMGYRRDGTLVRLADLTEDKAQLALEPPNGDMRVITSLDGPDRYAFGEPQWSPDGRWILLSDTAGRLLIVDERGRDPRELLPAAPARSWVEAPFLTWHQGETR